MIMGSCDQWDHMMMGLYDQWVMESCDHVIIGIMQSGQ